MSEEILEIKVWAKYKKKKGRRNSREEWATNFSAELKEEK